jgi:hypothetical protein
MEERIQALRENIDAEYRDIVDNDCPNLKKFVTKEKA